MPIYVDIDNTNAEFKLFIASKAGGAKTEEQMQKAVKDAIAKSKGVFTTDKPADGKGYALIVQVDSVSVGTADVTCSVNGAIAKRPRVKNKKKEEGEVMITSGLRGRGKVTGTSDDAIRDCVVAITEDVVKKALPFMKADWDALNTP